jgi:predicted nucleic acid-binding protein
VKLYLTEAHSGDVRGWSEEAEIHGLRGFDAVHLATAKQLKSSQPHISVAFSSFDGNLNKAAAAEKLTVLEPK